MKTYQDVRNEWLEVKRQYGEMIDRRIEMFKDCDLTTKSYSSCGTNFFPEERMLFKKSEVLRKKLLAMKLEDHCGNVVGRKYSRKIGTKYSKYGDNGFFVCCECHSIFKVKANKDGESFKNCSEHNGIKEFGQLKPITEGVQWL